MTRGGILTGLSSRRIIKPIDSKSNILHRRQNNLKVMNSQYPKISMFKTQLDHLSTSSSSPPRKLPSNFKLPSTARNMSHIHHASAEHFNIQKHLNRSSILNNNYNESFNSVIEPIDEHCS
jgi:hypothetical protein